MAKKFVVERRAGERLPLSIVVFVRGREGTGDEFLDLATIVNLSATGALVCVQRYAGPNMEISLEFPAPPVIAKGGVVMPNNKCGHVVRSASSRRGELWGVRFQEPLGVGQQLMSAAFAAESEA